MSDAQIAGIRQRRKRPREHKEWALADALRDELLRHDCPIQPPSGGFLLAFRLLPDLFA